MNATKQKMISVLVVGVNAISPLGQAIGFRAVTVGLAAVAAPAIGHAQKNHRLCGAIMQADNKMYKGVMMEVNKHDRVSCGTLLLAAENGSVATTTFRATLNRAILEWYKGHRQEHAVARMAPCEDVTEWWFRKGAYGGDVCNSMKAYKLYRFQHNKDGSFSISS